MTLLRLVLLLPIAAALTLFTLQNWSTTLQLTFLGVKSVAMPLSLWILGAIAAGIGTTIVISLLFRLTRFTAKRSVRQTTARSQPSQSYSYNPSPSYSSSSESPRTAWKGSSTAPKRDEDEDASDWFDDNSADWTDEPKDRSRPRTDFEAPNQQPKSGSQSGSSYSYTYREPTRSDVVDADFRVIVPPSRNLDDEDSEK